MHAFTSSRGGRSRNGRGSALFGVAALLTGLPLAAQPVITSQPLGVAAYESQSATFSVGATGGAPLRYQWRFAGNALDSATNSTLVLTNLAVSQTGIYAVQVTDTAGTTGSSGVVLSVLPRPFPAFGFGTFQPGVSPEVPIQFLAYGGETRVQVSVAYATNALSNPRYISSLTNFPTVAPGRTARLLLEGDEAGTSSAVIRTDSTLPGFFGIEIVLPTGRTLATGVNPLGRLLFDAREGAGPYQAALVFTNKPFAVEVGPVGGTNVTASLGTMGPVVQIRSAPVLDAQSGLFLQQIDIGNPGVITQSQVMITVSGLTNDSLGVPIRLYNSLGTNSNGGALVFSSDLPPGTARVLRLEYYVADLTTVPVPTLLSEQSSSILSPALSSRTLSVDRALYFTNGMFPSGAFLIEFPTQAGRNYFVQYAPTPEAFAQGSGLIRTARPAIPGTGSRVQWIDHGPPKTESAPGVTNRFYRVILGL